MKMQIAQIQMDHTIALVIMDITATDSIALVIKQLNIIELVELISKYRSRNICLKLQNAQQINPFNIKDESTRDGPENDKKVKIKNELMN